MPGTTKKTTATGEPTGKRRFFCEQYVADAGLNGRIAAIKAGYSKATAAQQAWKLLQDPVILTYIDKLKKQRSDRVQVDADYVLQQLHAIDQMDIIDIIEDDMTLKPLSVWPPTWRRYLNGFELAELFEGQGDVRKMMGVLKKIKWVDKLRNLELLGKHVEVGAFADRLIEEDAASLADRLAAARKRRADRQ